MGRAFLIIDMKVEFTKEFANKKKGDVSDLSGILSANLINRGVAKPYKEKKARKPRQNKNAAPTNLEDK